MSHDDITFEPVTVSSYPFAQSDPAAVPLLIDDFSDGNDDGWTYGGSLASIMSFSVFGGEYVYETQQTITSTTAPVGWAAR